MRSIVVRKYGGPEELRLEELPDPVPGPGEVLVRVAAAGVNPVETYRRAGSQGYSPALPFTPGSDAAGTVEAAGPGVSLRAGTRVWVSGSLTGTYAEKTLCPAEAARPLSERLSFAQGAAVGIPYGTAHRALVGRAAARPRESVLVHGATGGVGVAALQLARALGLRAAGTSGTPEGAELVRAQGGEAFGHAEAGPLLAWTGGRGFDVIVEMRADANLAVDLALLAPRGRVVVVGSRGAVSIDPRETMTRDAAILGLSLRNASPEERAQIDADLDRWLADGTLTPVVSRELPLAEAAEAHRLVMAPGHHGKIVLVT